MYKCCAGIVLFNPEIERLNQSIENIVNQVEKIYCYDNNSENLEDIFEVIKKYSNIEIITSQQNVGIAKALNSIALAALKNGFRWLLTLDQDSICPKNLVNALLVYAEDEPAIICPKIVDKRLPLERLQETKTTYVDFCITSGSMMDLFIWKKVGGFDEWMFIDLVDDEYCYRLKILGYTIIQNNSVTLDHEFGKIVQKKHGNMWLRIGDMVKIDKIKALSYTREVLPFRTYYATRNIVYLSRKYKKYSSKKFSKLRAATIGILGVIRGKKKISLMHAAISGYIDGMRVHVTYFDRKN